jgi:hypothetical protein
MLLLTVNQASATQVVPWTSVSPRTFTGWNAIPPSAETDHQCSPRVESIGKAQRRRTLDHLP